MCFYALRKELTFWAFCDGVVMQTDGQLAAVPALPPAAARGRQICRSASQTRLPDQAYCPKQGSPNSQSRPTAQNRGSQSRPTAQNRGSQSRPTAQNRGPQTPRPGLLPKTGVPKLPEQAYCPKQGVPEQAYCPKQGVPEQDYNAKPSVQTKGPHKTVRMDR